MAYLDDLIARRDGLLKRISALEADPATVAGSAPALGLGASSGDNASAYRARRLTLIDLRRTLADTVDEIRRLDVEAELGEAGINVRNLSETPTIYVGRGRGGDLSPVTRRRS